MRLRREKPPAHRRVVWQVASLLLAYPDDGQPGRLDTVQAAVDTLADSDRTHCWPAPNTCGPHR